MDSACNTNGEKLNAHRILVRNPEGKKPLGRRSHRSEHNTRTNMSPDGGTFHL
jgi:hypothetical protein